MPDLCCCTAVEASWQLRRVPSVSAASHSVSFLSDCATADLRWEGAHAKTQQLQLPRGLGHLQTVKSWNKRTGSSLPLWSLLTSRSGSRKRPEPVLVCPWEDLNICLPMGSKTDVEGYAFLGTSCAEFCYPCVSLCVMCIHILYTCV